MGFPADFSTCVTHPMKLWYDLLIRHDVMVTEFTHLKSLVSIKIFLTVQCCTHAHTLTHAHTWSHHTNFTHKLAPKKNHISGRSEEKHAQRSGGDDVTRCTWFPVALNPLWAKWKWRWKWQSLSGFVKLEQGAIWAEQHSSQQHTPLHNYYSNALVKSSPAFFSQCVW